MKPQHPHGRDGPPMPHSSGYNLPPPRYPHNGYKSGFPHGMRHPALYPRNMFPPGMFHPDNRFSIPSLLALNAHHHSGSRPPSRGLENYLHPFQHQPRPYHQHGGKSPNRNSNNGGSSYSGNHSPNHGHGSPSQPNFSHGSEKKRSYENKSLPRSKSPSPSTRDRSPAGQQNMSPGPQSRGTSPSIQTPSTSGGKSPMQMSASGKSTKSSSGGRSPLPSFSSGSKGSPMAIIKNTAVSSSGTAGERSPLRITISTDSSNNSKQHKAKSDSSGSTSTVLKNNTVSDVGSYSNKQVTTIATTKGLATKMPQFGSANLPLKKRISYGYALEQDTIDLSNLYGKRLHVLADLSSSTFEPPSVAAESVMRVDIPAPPPVLAAVQHEQCSSSSAKDTNKSDKKVIRSPTESLANTRKRRTESQKRDSAPAEKKPKQGTPNKEQLNVTKTKSPSKKPITSSNLRKTRSQTRVNQKDSSSEPVKPEETSEIPTEKEEDNKISAENAKCETLPNEKSGNIPDSKNVKTPAKAEKTKPSPTKTEKTKTLPTKTEKTKPSPTKTEKTKTSPTKTEKTKPSPTKAEKTKTSPTKIEKTKTASTRNEKTTAAEAEKSIVTNAKMEKSKETPAKNEKSKVATAKTEKGKLKSPKGEKSKVPPAKNENNKVSPGKNVKAKVQKQDLQHGNLQESITKSKGEKSEEPAASAESQKQELPSPRRKVSKTPTSKVSKVTAEEENIKTNKEPNKLHQKANKSSPRQAKGKNKNDTEVIPSEDKKKTGNRNKEIPKKDSPPGTTTVKSAKTAEIPEEKPHEQEGPRSRSRSTSVPRSEISFEKKKNEENRGKQDECTKGKARKATKKLSTPEKEKAKLPNMNNKLQQLEDKNALYVVKNTRVHVNRITCSNLPESLVSQLSSSVLSPVTGPQPPTSEQRALMGSLPPSTITRPVTRRSQRARAKQIELLKKATPTITSLLMEGPMKPPTIEIPISMPFSSFPLTIPQELRSQVCAASHGLVHHTGGSLASNNMLCIGEKPCDKLDEKVSPKSTVQKKWRSGSKLGGPKSARQKHEIDSKEKDEPSTMTTAVSPKTGDKLSIKGLTVDLCRLSPKALDGKSTTSASEIEKKANSQLLVCKHNSKSGSPGHLCSPKYEQSALSPPSSAGPLCGPQRGSGFLEDLLWQVQKGYFLRRGIDESAVSIEEAAQVTQAVAYKGKGQRLCGGYTTHIQQTSKGLVTETCELSSHPSSRSIFEKDSKALHYGRKPYSVVVEQISDDEDADKYRDHERKSQSKSKVHDGTITVSVPGEIPDVKIPTSPSDNKHAKVESANCVNSSEDPKCKAEENKEHKRTPEKMSLKTIIRVPKVPPLKASKKGRRKSKRSSVNDDNLSDVTPVLVDPLVGCTSEKETESLDNGKDSGIESSGLPDPLNIKESISEPCIPQQEKCSKTKSRCRRSRNNPSATCDFSDHSLISESGERIGSLSKSSVPSDSGYSDEMCVLPNSASKALVSGAERPTPSEITVLSTELHNEIPSETTSATRSNRAAKRKALTNISKGVTKTSNEEDTPEACETVTAQCLDLPPPKKKRGRPRTRTATLEGDSSIHAPKPTNQTCEGKLKAPSDINLSVQISASSASPPLTSGKKRGRPRSVTKRNSSATSNETPFQDTPTCPVVLPDVSKSVQNATFSSDDEDIPVAPLCIDMGTDNEKEPTDNKKSALTTAISPRNPSPSEATAKKFFTSHISRKLSPITTLPGFSINSPTSRTSLSPTYSMLSHTSSSVNSKSKPAAKPSLDIYDFDDEDEESVPQKKKGKTTTQSAKRPSKKGVKQINHQPKDQGPAIAEEEDIPVQPSSPVPLMREPGKPQRRFLRPRRNINYSETEAEQGKANTVPSIPSIPNPVDDNVAVNVQKSCVSLKIRIKRPSQEQHQEIMPQSSVMQLPQIEFPGHTKHPRKRHKDSAASHRMTVTSETISVTTNEVTSFDDENVAAPKHSSHRNSASTAPYLDDKPSQQSTSEHGKSDICQGCHDGTCTTITTRRVRFRLVKIGQGLWKTVSVIEDPITGMTTEEPYEGSTPNSVSPSHTSQTEDVAESSDESRSEESSGSCSGRESDSEDMPELDASSSFDLGNENSNAVREEVNYSPPVLQKSPSPRRNHKRNHNPEEDSDTHIAPKRITRAHRHSASVSEAVPNISLDSSVNSSRENDAFETSPPELERNQSSSAMESFEEGELSPRKTPKRGKLTPRRSSLRSSPRLRSHSELPIYEPISDYESDGERDDVKEFPPKLKNMQLPYEVEEEDVPSGRITRSKASRGQTMSDQKNIKMEEKENKDIEFAVPTPPPKYAPENVLEEAIQFDSEMSQSSCSTPSYPIVSPLTMHETKPNQKDKRSGNVNDEIDFADSFLNGTRTLSAEIEEQIQKQQQQEQQQQQRQQQEQNPPIDVSSISMPPNFQDMDYAYNFGFPVDAANGAVYGTVNPADMNTVFNGQSNVKSHEKEPGFKSPNPQSSSKEGKKSSSYKNKKSKSSKTKKETEQPNIDASSSQAAQADNAMDRLLSQESIGFGLLEDFDDTSFNTNVPAPPGGLEDLFNTSLMDQITSNQAEFVDVLEETKVVVHRPVGITPRRTGTAPDSQRSSHDINMGTPAMGLHTCDCGAHFNDHWSYQEHEMFCSRLFNCGL